MIMVKIGITTEPFITNQVLVNPLSLALLMVWKSFLPMNSIINGGLNTTILLMGRLLYKTIIFLSHIILVVIAAIIKRSLRRTHMVVFSWDATDQTVLLNGLHT